MNKEEIFKQFIYTLEDDIKNKTFLTYEEENEWKDYLKRIINSQTNKYKEVLDKIKEYIDNYDVFKEFTFPLMKRNEEQQVLTSIKYEFDTSIKKNLDKLLEEIK